MRSIPRLIALFIDCAVSGSSFPIRSIYTTRQCEHTIRLSATSYMRIVLYQAAASRGRFSPSLEYEDTASQKRKNAARDSSSADVL